MPSTIQLAWFGSADVKESIKQIQGFVMGISSEINYLKDMGVTTLTLTDGNPITFYNKQFVAVIPKDAKLFMQKELEDRVHTPEPQ